MSQDLKSICRASRSEYTKNTLDRIRRISECQGDKYSIMRNWVREVMYIYRLPYDHKFLNRLLFNLAASLHINLPEKERFQ